MFEARLQAVVFKRILDAIKDIIAEANLECSYDGISLQALDDSHVVLVALKLHADAFERYRCDRPLSLGLKIPTLVKIFKYAGRTDEVKITVDDGGVPDVASFYFESDDAAQSLHFQQKLIHLDSEPMDLTASHEHAAVISMPCADFKKVVSDLAVIGDSVEIHAQQQGVAFSAHGEIGDGRVTMHSAAGAAVGAGAGGEQDAVTLSVLSAIRMTCSAKYLLQFAKACPLAKRVVISMGEDYPIELEFALPHQQGYLRYYAAPKIDDDVE